MLFIPNYVARFYDPQSHLMRGWSQPVLDCNSRYDRRNHQRPSIGIDSSYTILQVREFRLFLFDFLR